MGSQANSEKKGPRSPGCLFRVPCFCCCTGPTGPTTGTSATGTSAVTTVSGRQFLEGDQRAVKIVYDGYDCRTTNLTSWWSRITGVPAPTP
eukprot:2758391-Rhodomonas_salina.1